MLHRKRGYTLVELVVVMMIAGVISFASMGFITSSSRTYVDVIGVNEVISDSRYVVERITKDIRNAVPNSIRIDSGLAIGEHFNYWQCIEMLPIEIATSYLNAPFKGDNPSESATIIDTYESWPQSSDLKATIYPYSSNVLYTSAASENAWHRITSSSLTDTTRTLLFNSQVSFSEHSPQKRLYVFNSPISYCVLQDATTMTSRIYLYKNYGFSISQPSPTENNMKNNRVVMGEGLTNPMHIDKPFFMAASNLLHSSLVMFTPEFQAFGQKFKYQSQIQVMNVP